MKGTRTESGGRKRGRQEGKSKEVKKSDQEKYIQRWLDNTLLNY